MRYDRDLRRPRREPQHADDEWLGRGEYGAAYEAPYRAGFRGYGLGYRGGALRSRGSYEAGQLRSGLNPVDEFEFEWGGGYVGGRGYGGTNYDYEQGYQSGVSAEATPSTRGVPPRRRRETSPATRGGYSWSEYESPTMAPRGPARYGYGPYHERLRRRRRSDDEIRQEVEETLFYDTWVDADRITVEVDDGVVTLRGTLPSYEEVRYATDDAWDVDGVRGVRTELQVDERLQVGRIETATESTEPRGRDTRSGASPKAAPTTEETTPRRGRIRSAESRKAASTPRSGGSRRKPAEKEEKAEESES